MNKIRKIYHTPLIELLSEAHEVHRQHHQVGEVQLCHLVSYKTGGCTEDCAYCAQSARYQTEVAPLPLMQKEELFARARSAVEAGASRICIGAAWRGVREGKAFDTILDVVKDLTEKGVEVCCTLGLLNEQQARRLKEAGLYAYNHNLDSSRTFYKTIITTRGYEERLQTLRRIEKAGIGMCCGGIIGMGESREDRIALLHTLSQLNPESIPLNFLSPIEGTPLQKQTPLPIWEMLRMIATARIALPKALIRLSAGRLERSLEEQALCFMAGANSIFIGEKLLTVNNPSVSDDQAMFELFGLKKRPPFKERRETLTSFESATEN
ncbi:MAG: biotin synthase BioB [Chlamydiales bacterium]|nr:biotin synthase BioB [Chlamydiales bacterium]